MKTRPLPIAILLGLLWALPAVAADPATTWATTCERCHADPAALAPKGDSAAAAVSLDVFLATHRMPDPAARAELIAWMLARTGG